MTYLLPLILFAIVGAMPDSPANGRHLVFDQDFSKLRKIDLKKWIFDDGPVYNDEIEKYTSATAGNAYLKDGCLVLEARKEGGTVTSARLQSVGHWKHPYVEVVASVPTGKGTWPAIWMLNDRVRRPKDKDFVDWPACGEIDIMENVGFDPGNFHFSLHADAYNWMKKDQCTATAALRDPTEFHKFAMDCTRNGIEFLVDDKEVYTVARRGDDFSHWPFDDSFFLILNLAIGGGWGGAEGVDEAIFPSRFRIKSVRVYQ